MNDDYDYDEDYVNDSYLSECCGAPILGEIVDKIGICSQCKEWSGVEKDPELVDETDDNQQNA